MQTPHFLTPFPHNFSEVPHKKLKSTFRRLNLCKVLLNAQIGTYEQFSKYMVSSRGTLTAFGVLRKRLCLLAPQARDLYLGNVSFSIDRHLWLYF